MKQIDIIIWNKWYLHWKRTGEKEILSVYGRLVDIQPPYSIRFLSLCSDTTTGYTPSLRWKDIRYRCWKFSYWWLLTTVQLVREMEADCWSSEKCFEEAASLRRLLHLHARSRHGQDVTLRSGSRSVSILHPYATSVCYIRLLHPFSLQQSRHLSAWSHDRQKRVHPCCCWQTNTSTPFLLLLLLWGDDGFTASLL